ncbi:Nif3-like dinuclear metal center hexameric protein [Desulfonatronovibrio magnus]|uniref:Nif3-like dinuclear metal center hexameric protein n=1 Tax=Desulfonatronovibrio magnus TaxID=698827 RepID=UPI0005EB67DC|nr:Nif3-like dinuclear metal center hexameric protein [Desulfonatronovibrio magnus]
MTLEQIIKIIEKSAPPKLAMDWDNCGIQVAGSKKKIKRLCIALDPDEKSIEQSISFKADFLLTHHPLTIKPRLPNHQDSFYRILKSLLTTDTILYSAHTSLDANPQGPVRWLADKIGLKNIKVLYPTMTRSAARIFFQHPIDISLKDNDLQDHILDCQLDDQGKMISMVAFHDNVDACIALIKSKVWPFYHVVTPCPEADSICGIGFTGDLPDPLSWAEFIEKLKNLLEINFFSQAGNPPTEISTISCCPGSGADLAEKAFAQGADVFITGDMKYHQAQDAGQKGVVLDVGHFILEEKMMYEWYLSLKSELSDIQINFIRGESPLKVV